MPVVVPIIAIAAAAAAAAGAAVAMGTPTFLGLGAATIGAVVGGFAALAVIGRGYIPTVGYGGRSAFPRLA